MGHVGKSGRRVIGLMLRQNEFDQFVGDYNADYLYLLTRASRGGYNCSISSFAVLKDLYNVVLTRLMMKPAR